MITTPVENILVMIVVPFIVGIILGWAAGRGNPDDDDV